MADNSIVNFGDLSKPATVLVEKISDAVGGVFKPYQIVRVAKAEAEADRIRAESRIEITDLERRAMHRFVGEEARKQQNIESITSLALPQVSEQAMPQDVEDDWIAHFFDKCRLISDSDMQLLWARVLAGQANAPGAFTKRTVDLLSSLDKSDAVLFTDLCRFCWDIDGDLLPLIYEEEADVYPKYGIKFASLAHLDSIALIRFSSFGFLAGQLPGKITATYHALPTVLEFPKEKDNEMETGEVLFTKAGQELARICDAQPEPGFREYIHEQWRNMGYVVLGE